MPVYPDPEHPVAVPACSPSHEPLRTIRVLFVPGDVIELRCLNVGRTADRNGKLHAGYFNFEGQDALSSAIRSVDGRADGVYAVLNRLNPDLLARSANRLRVGLKPTTTDADIIEWRWLYIDLDPSRPAGISSTDLEHQTAFERAVTIRDYLSGLGWPEPLYSDSGNGAHLLYRLPLLDLKSAAVLVKACLRSLSARFSDAAVKVDESTGNASRLCKLYGTMTRKGDSTTDRPHRRSRLIDVPERVEPVALDLLEALAVETTPPPTTGKPQPHSGPVGNFDIDLWIAQSGLVVSRGPEPYQDGRRWTLQTCPFDPEHQRSAIFQLANGALVFKCFHSSCAQYNWSALRRLIDRGEPNNHQTAASLAQATNHQSDETVMRLISDLSQLPSVFSINCPLDWCIDGMLAQGSVTLISAESGTGKTWLGYYLAGCVAHGRTALGRAVRPAEVLYLDGENPNYAVQQRLRDLGIADHPNLKVWGGWNTSPPVGPDHPLVIDFAARTKGLIVYDSLIEFHPGSEQSATETRAFMRHFRRLANLGATVVILHHTGKSDSAKQYRGSSDIKAAVDTAYLLSGNSETPEVLGKLSMKCYKARLAPGQNFSMEFCAGQGFVPCDFVRPILTVTEFVAELLADGRSLNQQQITARARERKYTSSQIKNCLETGPWIKVRGPNNVHPGGRRT
ncbi:MAG: AAA family ATPase [Acidobacteriota bacterium]